MVVGCHTETFLSLDGNPRRLWCRYSDNGESKGVIGIHVDDFLISLADGALSEKWMSEIKSLYRRGSWQISKSEFAGIRVRQHRDSGTEKHSNETYREQIDGRF